MKVTRWTSRSWLGALAALAGLAASAVAGPREAAEVRALLEQRFLPGVDHAVIAAEAPDGGAIGFLVEVPVRGLAAADRQRTARTGARLTAQAMQLIGTKYPGRPIAPWSAVIVGEATARPLDAVTPAGGRLPGVLGAATVGAGTAPASIRTTDPIEATRAASLPIAFADRLRRELAPIYPDARVEVLGRGPKRVEVWVTVITPQPSSANGPWIVDYVRRIIETIALREFPGVELVGGPNIGVRPYGHPDRDDLPPRDNGLARSRPQIELVGLSRKLEGRMRQELATRFATVEVTVSFVGPKEAVFEVRVESNGALTHSNRPALREYLRRTALTILGNEHPGIFLSARSRFTVWSKVRLPVEPKKRVERTTGFGAKLSTLRSRVIELPTAHTLFAGHRQAEVVAYTRNVKDGLYDNIVRYEMGGLDLGYRQGLVRGLELNLIYRTHILGAGVRDPATFTGASRGISVLTGSLKFTPFRHKGMELGGGVTQSLVSDLDRPHFLPDDWERFNNLFVVFSTPFAPGWRMHAAALQGMIPASGPSPSATVNVAGLAIEWLPFEQLRLAVEGVSETTDATSIGELGPILSADGESGFDNAHANASATIGLHSIGDVGVYARKINREIDRELGLTYFKRF